MENCERETIICLNDADKLDGYFVFGTSIKAHWDKVVRRVGGLSSLMEVRMDQGPAGDIRYWSCRVPIEFLDPYLGVRGKKRRRAISEADRQELIERMKRINAEKSST